MASLLTNHARSLSHYRTLLSTTQAQLAAVQQTLSNVESALAEARADEVFWKRRVQELDRENRLQALELTSAKRGKREAEQELARVRVELEDVRRGVKRVRVGGVRDREVQTDEEDADWVGRCTCGAARGFLVVEEEDTVEDGRVSAAAVAERRGEAGDGGGGGGER